mgnify:CR=1 FL=1
MAMLDTMANCCAYSPDGQVILIGYGCGIEGSEERKEGGYVALNEEDLTIVHEARDSKGMISDCKYTPDGKNFVLASLDGALYVYQASNYAAKAKCRGHSGKVMHFDISTQYQLDFVVYLLPVVDSFVAFAARIVAALVAAPMMMMVHCLLLLIFVGL